MRAPVVEVGGLDRDMESVVLTVDGPTEPSRLVLKRTRRIRRKYLLADVGCFRWPVSRPVREYRAIHRCREIGLETARPIACGQRAGLLPAAGFLVVAESDGGERLDALLARRRHGQSQPVRATHHLLYEFGRLIGRLHQGHLSLPGLQLRHVSVSPRPMGDAKGQWRLVLTEVEGLAKCSSRRGQARDLRRLLRSALPIGLARRDLYRFVLGYIKSRYAATVSRQWRLERSFGWAVKWLRRLPQWQGDQEQAEHFVRMGRVTVSARYLPMLQEHGIGSFSGVFGFRGGHVLGKPGLVGWRERRRIDLVSEDGATETIFLKRYDHPPVLAQFGRIVSRRASHSTAWWEWRQVRRLREHGIATPVPVAMGEKMGRWRERRSFIALAAARGESLERWAKAQSGGHVSPVGVAARRSLACVIGQLARDLHRAGFCHRDLYLCHVFADGIGLGDPKLTLIDLQRVFQPAGWRRRRWQVKDLAALHYSSPASVFSSTDRMRCYRSYLGLSGRVRSPKGLARQVLAKAGRIAVHDRRRVARMGS